MKKFKAKGVLTLNKETVSNLNETEMNKIKAGFLSVGDKCKQKKKARKRCRANGCRSYMGG